MITLYLVARLQVLSINDAVPVVIGFFIQTKPGYMNDPTTPGNDFYLDIISGSGKDSSEAALSIKTKVKNDKNYHWLFSHIASSFWD